jgi:hypothetical protein
MEEFNDDIPQSSHDKNNILIAEFSKKEVFDAIEQRTRLRVRIASRWSFSKKLGSFKR